MPDIALDITLVRDALGTLHLEKLVLQSRIDALTRKRATPTPIPTSEYPDAEISGTVSEHKRPPLRDINSA